MKRKTRIITTGGGYEDADNFAGMKRKTRIILVIIVVAAVVAPIGAYTVLLGTIEVPGVDVQKIEFNSYDRETGTIRFDVRLNMMNDNFFDAKLN